ncbi:MAG: choline trimethylamine-lyase, partial [Candidatus Methanoplasma sp.]|nr:choline trimethylamine-lyase [Candidatus Methanoplasma sp.]
MISEAIEETKECIACHSPAKGEELSPRLKVLKERYLAIKPSVSVLRAKVYTEMYKANPGLPMILLRARAFRKTCESAVPLIQDKELIVGHPCGKPRAGAFSPDLSWKWAKDEIDTMSTRSQDPYDISEDDKKTLLEEVFPFWEGRSLAEMCESRYREAGIYEFTAEAYVSDMSYHQTSGGGDTCPGFDVILMKKGFMDIKHEAEEHLSKLSAENPNDVDKIAFYKASIETCEGVIAYGKKLSDHAKKLAAAEADPVRKAELEKISEVCAQVPARAPRTFHEALQMVWTIESITMLEENQTGISLGRVDQYIYPFYKADIEAGRLTIEEAKDLIGCFLIKCSEMMWLQSLSGAVYFAGYQPYVNMCLGGQTRTGSDATNDLTLLLMDGVRTVSVYQPALSCRIHNKSPQAYLEKIVDVVRAGMGFPSCHFDDAHVKMMLTRGINIEDSRDYCLMGCVEPHLSGRLYMWTSTGYTQWPIAVEFVLNQGVMKSFGKKEGLDTGDLNDFKTYEQFEAAVKAQVENITRISGIGTIISQEVHRDFAPKPLMSLLVLGPMENGKDVMAGGALLNYGPGMMWSGLGTYADSMAAIKKLVFDTKKYTLEQIRDACAANFVGYEDLRRDCINAPKYGNDDDYVDLIASDMISFTETTHNKCKTLYSQLSHGAVTVSSNTPFGALTGATPNGRLDWMPLSDGMSPSQGSDKKGPTAIIKSVSKLNVDNLNIGMVHTFKIMRGILETSEGRAAIINLL